MSWRDLDPYRHDLAVDKYPTLGVVFLGDPDKA